MVDKNKKNDGGEKRFWFSIVFIMTITIIGNGLLLYAASYFVSIYGLLLLIIFIHYISTMGNQSIFYGYFQSWEWKPFWKDNDLKRSAGEHSSIIKSSLINCVIGIPIIIGIGYTLFYYRFFSLYTFDTIIWFDTSSLYKNITNAWVLSLYWYIILGFSLLFFGLMVYFLIYKYYPSYNEDNTPLSLDYNVISYRFYSIKDMYIKYLFLFIIISYTLLNAPAIIVRGIIESEGRPTSYMFILLMIIFVMISIPYRIKIRWLFITNILLSIFWFSWVFVISLFYANEYSIILVNILKWLIPISLIGTVLIILTSIGVVIYNWIFRSKNVDSLEYDELNKTMKPWLGFNSKFVSESYINEELKTFNELYQDTYSNKKWLFWIEYFFANIINRNVASLLQKKKVLLFEVLINWPNNSKGKEFNPSYHKMGYNEDDLKRRKKIKEISHTVSKPCIEDPEGDMFLNLELEKENVQNTTPSIWTVFYTTGITYLTILPYFVAYNVVMLIVFAKLAHILYVMDIILVSILIYGYVGVQGLIFLGFLLSIFANNMGVWLAWKKYYRLKKEGNDEALFFSIFKQRVLYQYIYEYDKNEHGEVITNNYELGLYPQINIEIIDDVAKELSPKYYQLYSTKFPLYKNNPFMNNNL